MPTPAFEYQDPLPLGADDTAMQPEIAARPFMFREGQVHLRPLGAPEPDPERPGDPRVDYDAPHRKPWGLDLVLYLLFKGISTGAILLGAILWLMGDRSGLTALVAPIAGVAGAIATAAVLIKDLQHPERFYYILTRPNWRSWMARTEASGRSSHPRRRRAPGEVTVRSR